jgi:hypothetical protein
MSLAADRIKLALTRHFYDQGLVCLTEFSLKSGRRVDLIALDRQDRITIIEVKSSAADFRADKKWPDYTGWADQFCFAVAEGFQLALLPGPQEAGIYITDGFEVVLAQAPPTRQLAAARRRALIRRLARHAMGRESRQQLAAAGLPITNLDGEEE